ncbi:MAG: FAD-binding oxidoreductase [Actinomycetota bacterium]|nr:FAD-binding oxidoreductase [Actinomycetota bacterium]
MHDLSTLSLWHDTMPPNEWTTSRPALDGNCGADVVIVGAGYTGLWTAYYLLQRDPALKVVLLEAQAVGFGASGRNGGWCSALLPMSLEAVSASHSREAAIRLQQAMHATVDEIARVVAHEGIECGFAHGGYVSLERNAAQLDRAHEHVRHLHSYGFTDDDYRMVDAAEASRLCGATEVVGGAFTPHCAAIHPARLVRGLARVVEALGATIHEHSAATEIAPHRVTTDGGSVTARVVVRATEAFTSALPGMRRTSAPIYSLMIATEPLPSTFWDEAGLHDRPTFADGRHMVIYGQRTADDRLAFGGRGAWYHWGSAMSPSFDRNDRVHAAIHATLRELFPALGDARITHRWGGAVAAGRDWWCHVAYDATTGMAAAGNYVGDGVGTTNLAGRTLADLITGTDSDLVAMPWVGHRSRKWEPEPFRYVGINSLMVLPLGADRREARTGTRSRWRENLLGRLTGGTG